MPRRIPAAIAGTLAAVLTVCLLGIASAARASTWVVGSAGDLAAAISGAQIGDTIQLAADITLTSNLPAVQSSVTIDGAGHTLSGAGQYAGLVVGAPVAVAIQNLTITDAVVTGATGAAAGAGGGPGLGGGIFVAANASVTVSNVTLQSNTANGGNGASGAGSGAAGSFGMGGGSVNGPGGFGGGAGGVNGGGGGAGLGGAVFVQSGGTLTVGGPLTINGNRVNAGNGAFDGGSGSAFGGGIFLQGTGTVTFAPAAGQTDTVSNVIADQSGNGGSGATAGNWILNKAGAGTLVLTANNRYTGGTAVTGGLINFSGSGNFNFGAITLNGGGLQWAAGNNEDISFELTPIGPNGAVFDTNGNNVELDSALSGSGGVTLADSSASPGTLTLTAANTYTGGTTIASGTLTLASGASLAAAGALTVTGGVFNLNGNSQTIGALSGTGGGQIQLGAGTLTVNQSTTTTYAGTILGTGGLVFGGPGTLVLSGANAYSGGTTIAGGLINFNSAGNFGSGFITLSGGGLRWAAGTATDISSRLAPIGPNGAIFDTNGGSVAFGTPLSGSGGVTLDDSSAAPGGFTLSGPNTYTGGTTVEAGTLTLGAGASLAAAGGLTVTGGSFNLNGNNQTVASLSGTGGTISLGAGRLTVDQTGATTYAGTISGAGGLTLAAGTLTLTGANTYSGGTSIGSGAGLTGTTTSLQGNIVDGGTLVFNQGGLTGTYAGSISGAGTLTLTGGGTVRLTGTDTLTGGTAIQSGTLQVGTSSVPGAGLAGNVLVDAGGTLRGHGTIGGTVTNDGAVSPGGSIGTLTIDGSYIQAAGATLGIEITPLVPVSSGGRGPRRHLRHHPKPGLSSSLLAVGGTADLAGTLALTFDPGMYAPGVKYTLLTAGDVSGKFGAVTGSGVALGLLVPKVSYTRHAVDLGFVIDPLPDFAATPNQYAVASALQQASDTAAGGDLVTVLNTLIYSSPAQLQADYAGMAGAAYTSLPVTALDMLHGAEAAVFGHWAGGAPAMVGTGFMPGGGTFAPSGATWMPGASDPLGQAGPGAWTQSLAGTEMSGNPFTAASTAQTSGQLLGYDLRLSPALQIGTVVGNWTSAMSMADGSGQTAGLTTGLVGGYGRLALGDWTLDTMAGSTMDTAQVTRPLAFASRTATSTYTAEDMIAAAQLGREMRWRGVMVTPTVGVDWAQTTLPAVSEGGAGSLNLTMAGGTITSLRGLAGLRVGSPADGRAFRWSAYAGYAHDFAATQFTTTATLAGAPGTPFAVSTPVAADNWSAGMAAGWRLSDAADLDLHYDTVLNSLETEQAGSIQLNFHF
jgi:fibronectin-binding autotransporter adhesin